MDINDLHKKACQGESGAEEELFGILTSRFRLFAHLKIKNKADLEEVVQDALMVIYAEYRKTTFRTSFAAWAIKVLDNRILNYYRKKSNEKRRLAPDGNETLESLSAEKNHDPDLKRQLLHCLKKICSKNKRYGRILNLHYQGYGTKEICSKMNMKPETLYSALSKSRAMLEKCLEKGDIK